MNTQKNFAIPYALTIINFYFLTKYETSGSIENYYSILIGVNYILKMFYYSLLCSKYTITRIELLFSLLTLAYYIFVFSYRIVTIIKNGEAHDDAYITRVQTEIGIAFMTALIVQHSVIMDIQMDCL